MTRAKAILAADEKLRSRGLTCQTDDLLARDGSTQIPSFVTSLPRGTETGQYLTVDLGGTNCRICLVDLKGSSAYTIAQSKHVVPRECMVNASHEPLFDFIARKISDFLQSNSSLAGRAAKQAEHVCGAGKACFNLAFTFSFTYDAVSISEGIVLQWDKGWDLPDAIGRDPCDMLQRAIDRLGICVDVCALTNDSVSTLMAEAYTLEQGPPPVAGLIFGTGTNATYVEKLENIVKLHGESKRRHELSGGSMVINTEWGGWFDEDPSWLNPTVYDQILDAESSNPKKQLLEKMVSGLYLAELLRLAIGEAARDNTLTLRYGEESVLHTPYGMNSSFLSFLAEDRSRDLKKSIDYITKTLKARDVTIEDARFIRTASVAIVRRAARLSGAALAAIILQSGRLSTPQKPEVAEKSYSTEFVEPCDAKASSSPRKLIAKATRHLRALLCFRDEESGELVYSAPATTDSLVNDEVITVGVDGSLFEFYPTFEADIRGALKDVPGVGPLGEDKVRFRLTRDGSSLGAALVAHSALYA